MEKDNANEAIDKILSYMASNQPKYPSDIDRRLQSERIDFNYTTLIKLMLHEELLDDLAGRYVISPNGTNVLQSGGWLKFNSKKQQENEIAKRKVRIDLRNAKYALPLSIISLTVALGSLIYTIFFKK